MTTRQARRRGRGPARQPRFHAALSALGLDLSPLEVTMHRVLADERARGLDRPRRSGLTRDEERELLARRD